MGKQKASATFTSRFLIKTFIDATKGDLIKGLAELIKNSDDAMERGKSNKPIYVIYTKKQNQINDVFICDQGTGMTTDDLQNYFLSAGKGATGGKNNYMGRGAFDALALTAENNYPYPLHATIWTNTQKNKNTSLLILSLITNTTTDNLFSGSDTSTEISKTILPKLDSVRQIKTLNKQYFGTVVCLSFPPRTKQATPLINQRKDLFLKKLPNFYLIRNLIQKRNVFTYELDSSKTPTRINYIEPKIDSNFTNIVTDVSFTFTHAGTQHSISAELTIKKSIKPIMERNHDFGTNILIYSERGEILDNTFFGRQKSEGFECLFGELKIKEWKKLRTILGSFDTLLDGARNGLNWSTSKELQSLERKVLLILDNIAKTQKTTYKNQPSYAKVFQQLNKIWQGQVKEPHPPPPPLNSIQFSKSIYGDPKTKHPDYFIKGLTKNLSLIINPKSSDIVPGKFISISSKPLSIIKINNSRIKIPKINAQVHTFTIPINCLKNGTTIITATTGRTNTTCKVIVENENIFLPKKPPYILWTSEPRNHTTTKPTKAKFSFNKKYINYGNIKIKHTGSKSLKTQTTNSIKTLKNLGEGTITLTGGAVRERIHLTCTNTKLNQNISLFIPITKTPEQKALIKEIKVGQEEALPWAFDDINGILYIHSQSVALNSLFNGKYHDDYLAKSISAREQFAIMATNAIIRTYAEDISKHELGGDKTNITAENWEERVNQEIMDWETKYGQKIFNTIKQIGL